MSKPEHVESVKSRRKFPNSRKTFVIFGFAIFVRTFSGFDIFSIDIFGPLNIPTQPIQTISLSLYLESHGERREYPSVLRGSHHMLFLIYIFFFYIYTVSNMNQHHPVSMLHPQPSLRTAGNVSMPFGLRHRCRFCQKHFASKSGLQIHLRSHTGPLSEKYTDRVSLP